MHMRIKKYSIFIRMADLAEQLASRIRELRGDLTQEAFARRLGIHQATLNRIELKKQNVTLETLQKICQRLECSIGWLFGED